MLIMIVNAKLIHKIPIKCEILDKQIPKGLYELFGSQI